VNVRKKEVFSTVYDVSYLAAKQDYSPVHAGAVGGVNNRIGVLGCWSVGRPQTDQWSILWLMSTLPNARDLLEGHITLELDSIDSFSK
jgi:hypothetical protein